MKFEYDELEILKLNECLGIWEAAAALLGIPPSAIEEVTESDINGNEDTIDYRLKDKEEDKIYKAVIKALISSAKKAQSIKVEEYWKADEQIRTTGTHNTTINLFTDINMDSLQVWVKHKGFKTKFFPNSDDDRPAYLRPELPEHSQSLKYAIEAWQAAVNSEEVKAGTKTPKAEIEDWLRDNTDLSNEAIKNISTVANWSKGGGRPLKPKNY